jgi:hypothetical protein
MLRSVLIRLAGIVAAVLVAAVTLVPTFMEWRDTGYGNLTQYYDGRSDLELWWIALSSAVVPIGGTLILNWLVTHFVTNRYPIGRVTYWITFLLIAWWTTQVTRIALEPVSDASMSYIAIPLSALPTIICVAIGAGEMVSRSGNRTDETSAVGGEAPA